MSQVAFILSVTLLLSHSHAGPVKGFVELDSIPAKIACTEKIVVAREKIPGEYFGIFYPEINGYNLNEPEIARDIYSRFGDNYDFLMLHPQKEITDANLTVHSNATGIGFYGLYTAITRYSSNVKAIMGFSSHTTYQFFGRNPQIGSQKKFLVDIALHELGHTWCCSVTGFYKDEKKKLSAHYHSGMQLFGEDSLKIDPLQYDVWYPGTRLNCININQQEKLARFSELSQYFMGLRAPEEVKPIQTNLWDETSGVLDSKIKYQIGIYGPTCIQGPDFIQQKQVDIRDVIRLNGERVPSFRDSQKNFNALNVILVPYGEKLDTGLVGYLEILLDSLKTAWTLATDGRSILGMGCDLNAGIRKGSGRTFGNHELIQFVRRNVIRVQLDGLNPTRVSVDLFELGGKRIGKIAAAKSFSGELEIPLESSGISLRPGPYLVILNLDGTRLASKVFAVLE